VARARLFGRNVRRKVRPTAGSDARGSLDLRRCGGDARLGRRAGPAPGTGAGSAAPARCRPRPVRARAASTVPGASAPDARRRPPPTWEDERRVSTPAERPAPLPLGGAAGARAAFRRALRAPSCRVGASRGRRPPDGRRRPAAPRHGRSQSASRTRAGRRSGSSEAPVEGAVLVRRPRAVTGLRGARSPRAAGDAEVQRPRVAGASASRYTAFGGDRVTSSLPQAGTAQRQHRCDPPVCSCPFPSALCPPFPTILSDQPTSTNRRLSQFRPIWG
jgi:hypothetical protein